MVCLEVKPVAAGWMVQTNPLSYDGPVCFLQVILLKLNL